MVRKASAEEVSFLREEVASSHRDLELAINDFEAELEELRTANRSLTSSCPSSLTFPIHLQFTWV